MKEVIISEWENIPAAEDGTFILDLRSRDIRDCTGCWCCWQKTPGRCASHDLDDFYKAFLHAGKAVFYAGVSCDFVSGKLKTLFDRMIPHFLPYTTYSTGESMHETRYDHYPEVEVYYKGEFSSDEARTFYEEYLQRVFYQFHLPKISIYSAEEKEVRAV